MTLILLLPGLRRMGLLAVVLIQYLVESTGRCLLSEFKFSKEFGSTSGRSGARSLLARKGKAELLLEMAHYRSILLINVQYHLPNMMTLTE